MGISGRKQPENVQEVLADIESMLKAMPAAETVIMSRDCAQMLVDYFRDVGRPIEQWEPAPPGTEYIDGKKD